MAFAVEADGILLNSWDSIELENVLEGNAVPDVQVAREEVEDDGYLVFIVHLLNGAQLQRDLAGVEANGAGEASRRVQFAFEVVLDLARRRTSIRGPRVTVVALLRSLHNVVAARV